jgi:hypothetical protein
MEYVFSPELSQKEGSIAKRIDSLMESDENLTRIDNKFFIEQTKRLISCHVLDEYISEC